MSNTMFKIETKNKPRSKLVRDADPSSQCVRVYKASPEEVMLQLWSGNRYTLVALMPGEARAIAEQLVVIADELQLKPLADGELTKLLMS